jgi:hypothetical protein
MLALKSRNCIFCRTWKNKNKNLVEAAELDGEELLIPEHNCTKNHDGSSSSMELRACLEMVIDLLTCMTTSTVLLVASVVMMIRVQDQC